VCAEFAAKRKRPRFGEIFSVLSIFVFCSRIWCFCLNRKSVGCGFGRQKKGEKKTVGEEFLGRIRLFCLLFCVLRVVCTRHGIVLHKCCQVVTQPRLGFLQIGKAGDNTVCGICCFVQKAHGLIFLLCFSELCVKRCLQTRRGKREEVAVNEFATCSCFGTIIFKHQIIKFKHVLCKSFHLHSACRQVFRENVCVCVFVLVC